MTARYCVWYDHAVPYAPPSPGVPSEQPAAPAGTYGTIGDLGAELDRMQLQLDMALGALRTLTTQIAPAGGVTPGTTDPVTPGAIKPTNGAIGCVVTVSGIPAAVSEDFADLTTFLNLGRITLWTQYGPLAPIRVEHNPMVVMPFPVGVTGVTVGTMVPSTATVQLLYPPKQ